MDDYVYNVQLLSLGGLVEMEGGRGREEGKFGRIKN
mgnify:CR=1 FL=1